MSFDSLLEKYGSPDEMILQFGNEYDLGALRVVYTDRLFLRNNETNWIDFLRYLCWRPDNTRRALLVYETGCSKPAPDELFLIMKLHRQIGISILTGGIAFVKNVLLSNQPENGACPATDDSTRASVFSNTDTDCNKDINQLPSIPDLFTVCHDEDVFIKRFIEQYQTKRQETEETILRAAAYLLEYGPYGEVQWLVISLRGYGSLSLNLHTKQFSLIHSKKVEVVDPVSVGDVFRGGLLYELCNQMLDPTAQISGQDILDKCVQTATEVAATKIGSNLEEFFTQKLTLTSGTGSQFVRVTHDAEITHGKKRPRNSESSDDCYDEDEPAAKSLKGDT